MSAAEAAATNSVAERRTTWWLVWLAVGGIAFAARLIPVLRTGGLDAIGQYDSAIYFSSAVGLLNGRLPYRDFLLLHPPGSTLALTPFAALGLVIGDGQGWAVARIAMMLLGSLTAVLVARVLRPLGLVPALIGGLCYALLLPAVAIETTTRLEGLAACCLVGALVLVCVDDPRTTLRPWPLVFAGALLGFAASVKIWGVLPLLVAGLYLLITAGVRRAAVFAAGAAAAGIAVCLPFLLAAPTQMWRQVVSNQFGRQQANRSTLDRLADITGLGLAWDRLDESVMTTGVVAASIVLGIAGILALRIARIRLAVILLAVFVGLLISGPVWFAHYAGLSAGVLAITVGAAASVVLGAVSHAVWRRLVTGLGGVALLGMAAQLSQAEIGVRFPAGRMAATVAPLPGCITADNPAVLLAMNTLSRNLRRGCPLVLDLGGYSYDFSPRRSRARDPRWQRFYLDYMASGTATMRTRYHTGFGLTRSTMRTVDRWPVIAEIDGFELRRPVR